MEEMDFKEQLKQAFEGLDARIKALEHSVNDVIIGSLESAANEYADNEAYNTFNTKYGERINPLSEPYKKLFGEDYDLSRSLYDDLKSTEGYGEEGFDEESCMMARIQDLEERLKALKEDINEKTTESEEEVQEQTKDEDEGEKGSEDDEESGKPIPLEQLEKEFKEAMKN